MGILFKKLFVRDKDQNIIHVYQDSTFHKWNQKQNIHYLLKGCRRIAKTKEHDCRFKKAKFGLEGCLLFIFLFDLDIVVLLVNI